MSKKDTDSRPRRNSSGCISCLLIVAIAGLAIGCCAGAIKLGIVSTDPPKDPGVHYGPTH